MLTAVAGTERNFSYNYDEDMYSSMWVAYPLYAATTVNNGYSASWKSDPNIPVDSQINIWKSSYGVNLGSTDSQGYDSSVEFYARGHQIPNADRRGNETMQSQTYFATNSTPQIQSGFNAGIWEELESDIRAELSSTDTIYVATGPSFSKVGETREVTWILPKNETTKTCPVPNYYWKVLLKVKRDSGGNVTSASTVGFWFEHKVYTGVSYADYAVSVDQIEQWTGFDFFVNLPDAIETSVESSASWTSFQNF